jgi:RNA polymerase sigma factor (TIGR02999 family)
VARRRASLPLVSDLTRILDRARQGETNAADELLPLVYDELRKLAAARMAREAPGQTLQPTALVHEAWLRLIGSQNQEWHGRRHFFGAAAEAMRRILIDNARRKRALKRNALVEHVDLENLEVAAQADEETLLVIQDALDKLAGEDPRSAELVKLRFFVGMGNRDAAEVLGISERSAKRLWTFARAWLYHEIQSRRSAAS